MKRAISQLNTKTRGRKKNKALAMSMAALTAPLFKKSIAMAKRFVHKTLMMKKHLSMSSAMIINLIGYQLHKIDLISSFQVPREPRIAGIMQSNSYSTREARATNDINNSVWMLNLCLLSPQKSLNSKYQQWVKPRSKSFKNAVLNATKASMLRQQTPRK